MCLSGDEVWKWVSLSWASLDVGKGFHLPEGKYKDPKYLLVAS